jgi:pyrophosphatase PpaX
MKGFKAVLFDLDGTLIYSKGVIGKCINETLEHFDIKPFDKTELHTLVGMPLREALSLKTSNVKPLMDYFRELYMSIYKDETWIYDGMASILSMLKDKGKKVGIVTLKATFVAEEVLKGLNILNFVDAVEGDDDISELKPSPDQIKRICRKMGIEPEQTMVVGDTTMDIVAGKNAGCKTIGVLWGAMSMDDLSDAGADFLARSPEELRDLLRKL